MVITYSKISNQATGFSGFVGPKLLKAYSWCRATSKSFAQYLTTNAPKAWKHTRTFVVTHQKEIKIAGVALGVAYLAWRIYKYWESLPEHPQSTLESCLHFAKITVGMPEQEKESMRHIRLVFCLDTSGSMEGDRESAVKEGMKEILQDAANRVGDEVQIEIAVVGFNHDAYEISPLKSLNTQSVTEIIASVRKYHSDGTTSIPNGVNQGCEELASSGENPISSSALILLTDGEDDINSFVAQRLRQRVQDLGAQFFAIGIGSYKKSTLEQLTDKKNIIDTTKGTSIAEAISILYRRAIAKFSELTLHCTHESLKSVLQIRREAQYVNFDENGEVNLGELVEGKIREFQVYIDYLKVKDLVDLSTLELELHYSDPRGIAGRTVLPWNPTTKIDPNVFK